MLSPLKDNTSYSQCGAVIKKLIPTGSVVESFLFFSGELELNLAHDERFIIAHTNKYVIYEFWRSIMEEPWRIAEIVEAIYPIKEEKMFYSFQEKWPTYKDPAMRSALFFLLNRCSEEGHISAGAFDNTNFNPLALKRLSSFSAPKTFHVRYDQSDNLCENIKNSNNTEYKIIPAGRFHYNLMEYGINKGFDMYTIHHRQLCDTLKATDDKWVLIYKNHSRLYSIFKDHNIKMINKYGRLTPIKDQCEELIIANF